MLWLWLFISGLILIIILLLIKIHLLRKSAQEIESSFSEKLITDSNTLIDISSNDKYMRHLANEINIQLRKLQAERRKFQKGDLELKNAVTNISHDLRTPLTNSGKLSLGMARFQIRNKEHFHCICIFLCGCTGIADHIL